MRLAVVFSLIVFLAVCAPFYYFAIYTRARDSNQWNTGKGLSRNIQSSIISQAIGISFIYLFTNLFPIPEGHGFMSMGMGVLWFLGALATHSTNKFVESSARIYLDRLNIIVYIASFGLLYPGMSWFINWEPWPYVEYVMYAISMICLVLLEISFLKANRYKFLPSHPK